MTVRWGIIGLGDIAERNVVPAIAMAADTELVAVLSRRMEKAEAFASRHKVARAYDSLEKMLGDSELDAVYIATPNSMHAEQTIAAARAGKHVLCDKPMAITVHDGERMIEACDEHNVKLGVVFQNRYHPAHLEARRHIQSGILGEIQLVKAQLCVGSARGCWQGWRRDPTMAGSGAINGQALHPVDLLRFLLDSEVEEVRSMTDELSPDRCIDNMVYSVLRFRNGVHGVVIAGILVPFSDNDVTLYGSRGKIVSKGTLGRSVQGMRQELILESDSVNEKKEFLIENTPQARMTRLIENFNKSILENTGSVISGQNGLQMVRIANAILESSVYGQPVKLPAVPHR